MPATSHDVMPDIELYQPTDEENALALANSLGSDGWILGGGQDTYGWLKDRNKTPVAMIELTQIDAWKGIKETADGVEIGAVTTLTEIVQNPLIQSKFALLATAASKVASPQIRNVGTLGGNLNQDARCWYYRRGLDCYRAGGNICYADSPEGLNREHALFGASRCVAVTASDTAPALVALDATMVVASSSGQRLVSAQDFFVGPDRDITSMTVLNEGEILTAVRLPNEWANAEFYFEKVADRNVWDFALVNVAAAMKVSGGSIEDARIVCGAVECTPRRLEAVENAVRGQQRSEQLANQVAAIASDGARPLNYNHFKVPLMENLVKRAIRG
ncbi:MAG: xanthine dehydrogenase family protein subunit M [Gammaproteobacteria bacterium]|jgi:xanthine dehydrogenase YagS FAD-binding subunit|nr:xanthine dehydrogenase family protein subunit M [Gammaproteobacteria bacterium]MBT3860138.1 xanthine dehydrogenase family protein subunit M [Gammaproteobacteria bacterium]MBT3987430.1 xanthine dehydrogenase family protein subunit M [Gammaproteobacteria bacterium]MBT4255153.1 xanthine dehydrogenase family protein subunit M [Gammaproteobacteria bacterium]MBT4581832.1 xanthine dehydrogenase family protein subunit M [Gammaproteobacteria bacterium]